MIWPFSILTEWRADQQEAELRTFTMLKDLTTTAILAEKVVQADLYEPMSPARRLALANLRRHIASLR